MFTEKIFAHSNINPANVYFESSIINNRYQYRMAEQVVIGFKIHEPNPSGKYNMGRRIYHSTMMY